MNKSKTDESMVNASQSLWDFALAFYAQPQVAETCVRVQDEYQANVCLLIGLHWLDRREQYLDEVGFAALKVHIQGWTKKVVEPLRALRRTLKSPIEDIVQDEAQMQLRSVIQQAELLAEKKLLIEIESWVSLLPTSSTAQPVNNLARYMMQLNAPRHLIECLQGAIT